MTIIKNFAANQMKKNVIKKKPSPANLFFNVSTKPPTLLGAAGNPNARVAGYHSISLGVTKGSGGAKEFVPPGYLELLTLRGKYLPASEAPLLRIRRPKEQGQMEAKSFSS